MNPVFSTILGLVARHFLTVIGGWLIAKGYFAPDDQSLTALMGALTTLGGIVWSVVQKVKAGQLTPTIK